jgi:hypothetical protein
MSEPRRRKATILSLLSLLTVSKYIGNSALFDFFRALVIQAIGVAIVSVSLSNSNKDRTKRQEKAHNSV